MPLPPSDERVSESAPSRAIRQRAVEAGQAIVRSSGVPTGTIVPSGRVLSSVERRRESECKMGRNQCGRLRLPLGVCYDRDTESAAATLADEAVPETRCRVQKELDDRRAAHQRCD